MSTEEMFLLFVLGPIGFFAGVYLTVMVAASAWYLVKRQHTRLTLQQLEKEGS